MLPHTNTFTHRRFYTQTITNALTHKRFDTQTLLHENAFTHKRFRKIKHCYTQGRTRRKRYCRTNQVRKKKHQRLTLEPRFVRKGCRRACKIAKIQQFLTLEPHFVRPSGHISWLLVGTACGLKRDKKKKERETVTEGKRERESWER